MATLDRRPQGGSYEAFPWTLSQRFQGNPRRGLFDPEQPEPFPGFSDEEAGVAGDQFLVHGQAPEIIVGSEDVGKLPGTFEMDVVGTELGSDGHEVVVDHRSLIPVSLDLKDHVHFLVRPYDAMYFVDRPLEHLAYLMMRILSIQRGEVGGFENEE